MVDGQVYSLSVSAEQRSCISDVRAHQFVADEQDDDSGSPTGVRDIRVRFFVLLVGVFEGPADAALYSLIDIVRLLDSVDLI